MVDFLSCSRFWFVGLSWAYGTNLLVSLFHFCFFSNFLIMERSKHGVWGFSFAA